MHGVQEDLLTIVKNTSTLWTHTFIHVSYIDLAGSV